MAAPLPDCSRLCIHSITTKPWSLPEIIDGYTRAGVPALTLWRMHYEDNGVIEAAKRLRDSALRVTSLCRGGFFTASSARDREHAKDENRRIIDEAVVLGTNLIVLVCGATPGIPLPEQRRQILDGIAAVLPHAQTAKVRLAIEPLHPMYADSRSAVNTLEQANNMVTALNSDWLGVTIDVYHLWWDPTLKSEIERAGRSLFSFHVSDWRTPTRDILNDRALMGEGCIDIPAIRAWVEHTGFRGDIEVEIFSNTYWEQDQAGFLQRIKQAYLTHV